MENEILTVGFDKGEADFRVNHEIYDLSREQMKDFREMIIVGIGIAEEMWRKNQDMRNPAGSSTTNSNPLPPIKI